jgi:hypothetical protein
VRGWKSTKLFALATVVALSFIACGEDEPPEPQVEPSPAPVESPTSEGPAAVSAETYVSSLCSALQNWITALQEGQAEVQGTVEPGNAESGKQALATFFDGAVADTQTMISTVEAIGTPDVDGGDTIAQELLFRFTEAKTALEGTRAQVDTLPTDNPQAFAAAATELGGAIQTQLESVGDALSTISQPDLDAATNADPTCQSLGTTTGG